MKRILSLLAGMAFVFTVGFVLADDSMTETKDNGDKIIRNDDLSHIDINQDRATVNQMPAESGAGGSAAGGIGGDSNTMKNESDSTKAPVEKTPVEPGTEGSGAGGTDTYSPGY